ncbi:hypothetical protein [Candidatus Palauibacter sp.]|uniref:hypothetical protein n=1 Tax=Candidatus Palauibacter sp. TaxID=3101350 RepID=UPI003B02703F
MRKTAPTLLEDVARRWRGKAVEMGRRVFRRIRALLVRTRPEEDSYETAMNRYLARAPRRIDWPDGRRPARKQLYDRPGLR